MLIQTNFMYISSWLKNFIHVGKPETWLGFWGTYIGSILTVIFTHIDATMQINKNKELEYNRMEAVDLRSLMSIIIQRKNEYIDCKNLAIEIKNAINSNNSDRYKQLLDDANILQSSNLNAQEISHTNEWNKHFVIFEDNDPEIKYIVHKWTEISNLLEDYQQKVNVSIKQARETKSSKNMVHYEETFEKSAQIFHDMEVKCDEIYKKLRKIYESKVK